MKSSQGGNLPQKVSHPIPEGDILLKQRSPFHLILIIVLLGLLSACNRAKEPELVELPTAVSKLAAISTPTPKPTDTPPPTTESTSAEVPVEEAASIEVGFADPLDGAVVSGTFGVEMSARGILVEPSGEVKEGSGHMHILVDADFTPAGEVIGKDEQHLHFGDGSLTTELTLSPGEHVLRLQMADGAHIAFDGNQYRDEITITVADGSTGDEVGETPAEVEIGFADPLDGAVVSGTFGVEMSASGILVEPSGEVKEGSGHMHILVDTDFTPAGEVIAKDEQHLHFGDGSLTTELTLPPGEHVLRLQIADGAHIAFDGDQYRDEITITVADGSTGDEAGETPAEVEIGFADPLDGAVVSGTFGVEMSASGILVEPSGEVKEGSGHMHILVDTDFTPAGEVIAKDEQHLHFGDGSLVTELTLSPGEHVLRLQIADGAHFAFDGDQYRDEITITVAGDVEGDESESGESEDSESDDAAAPADGEVAGPRPPAELWVSITCNACHNINENQSEENRGPVGPHQNNLYERAGERVEGMTAEEYVYNSIVNPNDYIVESYFPNVMLKTFAEQMTEEEIRGLVDWMLDPNREGAPE